MTYLKEISDVHSESNIVIINGYRTDSDNPFSMEITKNEDGVWVKLKAGFRYRETVRPAAFIIESLSEIANLDKQAQRNDLFKEVIIHPKVRLHTLF